MGYSFSKTSASRLATCHEDLQKIANLAIKVSAVDFGIAEGHRSIERQKMLYAAGKSKIDGTTKKGKHNYDPSLAFDVYAYVKGKASYSERDLCYIGGVMKACAEILHDQGMIYHKLRWGGNWDGDGQIVTDQGFIDLPHFELIA